MNEIDYQPYLHNLTMNLQNISEFTSSLNDTVQYEICNQLLFIEMFGVMLVMLFVAIYVFMEVYK